MGPSAASCKWTFAANLPAMSCDEGSGTYEVDVTVRPCGTGNPPTSVFLDIQDSNGQWLGEQVMNPSSGQPISWYLNDVCVTFKPENFKIRWSITGGSTRGIWEADYTVCCVEACD